MAEPRLRCPDYPNECWHPFPHPPAPETPKAATVADEYTPTTEQVRRDYAAMTSGSFYEAEQEFDRWLAERDAETRRKALEPVAALHQPVVYYHHPDIEDDGAEWIRPLARLQELFERESADEFSAVSGTWDDARVFVTERTYCRHCQKVVEEAVEPYEVPLSPLAVWPCATAGALAEGGENRG
jgi:hypothetical protein